MPEDTMIPEETLIAHLPEVWRRRFMRAVEYMQQHLDEPLNWNSVAQHCGVSANYFHSMFATAFGETPASYQRRLRLKQVVFQLYFEPEKKVIDVALDAGFSSSQALAKVLKRELGTSAKVIRQQQPDDNYLQLRHKLEHTVDGSSLEKQLSGKIHFSVEQQPEQFFYLTTLAMQDIRSLGRRWGKIAPGECQEAVILSPWPDMEDLSQPFQLGYRCKPEQANTRLPARKFLTCRVKVRSGTSYVRSWESLYYEAMQRGLELDESLGMLETIDNPRDWLAFSAEMTLRLPLAEEQ